MIRLLASLGAVVLFWLVGHSSSGELLAFLPLLALIPAAAAAAAPAAAGISAGAAAGIGAGAAAGVGAAALGASSYVPGAPGPGPYAAPPAGPTGPYVPGAPGLGPYATPQQMAARAQPTGSSMTSRIIKGALKGLAQGDRRAALGQLDARQAMPRAGGGGVPGFEPPQIGVTEALIDRVQNTRGQYPAVPGLGG